MKKKIICIGIIGIFILTGWSAVNASQTFQMTSNNIGTGLPDLIVTDLKFEPDELIPKRIHVTAILKNIGETIRYRDLDLPIMVGFYWDNPFASGPPGGETPRYLGHDWPTDTSLEVSFPWPCYIVWPDKESHIVSVKANHNNQLRESDTTNNVYYESYKPTAKPKSINPNVNFCALCLLKNLFPNFYFIQRLQLFR
jgi:hypothetical protein